MFDFQNDGQISKLGTGLDFQQFIRQFPCGLHVA